MLTRWTYVQVISRSQVHGQIMPKVERQMRAEVARAIEEREKANMEADEAVENDKLETETANEPRQKSELVERTAQFWPNLSLWRNRLTLRENVSQSVTHILGCGGNVVVGLRCVLEFRTWALSALSLCFATSSFLFFLCEVEDLLSTKARGEHRYPTVKLCNSIVCIRVARLESTICFLNLCMITESVCAIEVA